MNVKNISLTRAAGLLAGALLITANAPLLRAAAVTAEADALPTFTDNYIKVGANIPALGGSHAAFQKGTQISRRGTGGIEEFNYTIPVDKETNLQIDGRALAGAEDYLAQFRLTKEKVGSLEAGYKRVRTFYDGLGGFFPLNNQWIPLYTRALFVDRGNFFLNATIALPKAPVYTFNYRNETRTGRKDSTIMGDTDLTGVAVYRPAALNLYSSNRKIIPAYIDLGERQETWEAAVKHTVGDTTFRLAVIGNRINNLDTRTVDRYPGEVAAFPAYPANPPTPIIIPPLQVANANKGFDQQGFQEEALTWTGKIETKVNAEAKTYFSASRRHATIDTAASRLITASIMTGTGVQQLVGGFTPGGRSPYSPVGTGKLKEDVLTGVLGVEFTPTKELELNAALKGEDLKISGNYNATYVTNMVVQATGVVTPVPLNAPNSVAISERPWVPEVSARYTGIKDVALFGTWDYRTLKQDEKTSYVGLTTGTTAMVLTAPAGANDKVKEKHSNLKIGGNWRPNSMVTLRGEFFTKDHENNFAGYGPNLGSYYILNTDIYGARATATVRPAPTVSFSTRYVMQRSKAQESEDGFLKTDSGDSRRYELAETIDWNPSKLVYVQGSANVVWDSINTVYPRAGGLADKVLQNAANNFWNGSILTGYVIDKETDAQVQATYYRAKNYNPSVADATMPYGQGGRDYSLTVGLKHKFSDRMVGSAKVGYFNSNNATTGGFANFKGTVGYLTLDYRL